MNKTNHTPDESEIVAIDEIEDLRLLSKKIDDASGFVNAIFDRREKKLYRDIVSRLRKETHGELTETEYSNTARMIFWCNRFECIFAGQSASEIDPDLFNMYRLTMMQITEHLKSYREKSTAPPSTIKDIKNYIILIEKEKKIRAKFEDPETAIIDVEEEKK